MTFISLSSTQKNGVYTWENKRELWERIGTRFNIVTLAEDGINILTRQASISFMAPLKRICINELLEHNHCRS